MNNDKELIEKLFSEYQHLFTPDEKAILIDNRPKDVELLFEKKLAEFRNDAAISNILAPNLCDYDNHGAEVLFFRLFSSVNRAKSRLLYAQSVSRMKYPSTHYTKRKGLDSYLLTYTLGGQGVLEYQGKRYDIKPGDAFLIDCRLPHFYYANSKEGWEYDIIHFNGLNMPEFFSVFTLHGAFCFSFDENSDLVRDLNALYDACSQLICSEFTVNMLLTCLLTRLIDVAQLAKQTNMPPWVEQAISHINLHFSNELTLEDIASTVNISKFYLAREFKRYTGQTVNEYLRTVRVNAAKSLLTSTDLPISLIAEKVGYSSQYHFISTFKAFEGKTPLQFRKQWTL